MTEIILLKHNTDVTIIDNTQKEIADMRTDYKTTRKGNMIKVVFFRNPTDFLAGCLEDHGFKKVSSNEWEGEYSENNSFFIRMLGA